MTRYFIVFVALTVSPVVLSGENEAQQENRGLTPEYGKAHRRFERACSKLDQENVAELQRRAERLHKDGWKKGAIRRDGREWCEERGILQDYQGCVGKIVNLLFTPKHIELPPPRMSLADLDPTTRKYVEAAASRKRHVVESRERDLERARRRLDDIRRSRGGSMKYKYPTRKARKAARRSAAEKVREARRSAAEEVDRLEKALAQAKSTFYKPGLPLRVGSVGHVGSHEIFQILDESEMYLEIKFLRDDSQLLAVKGVSTAGLVDGRVVSLAGVFEITGTKTYTTAVGGSNTVFVAEPVEVDLAAARKWSRGNSQP